MKKFSKREAIQFGWQTTKSNLPFLIGILLVAFVIQAIPSWIGESVHKNSRLLWVLFGVISGLIQMVVTLGFIRISLRLAAGEQGQFGDLFECYPLIIKYFVSSIIYGVMVTIGTILLIVPGIILAIKYQFYAYLLVDRKLGPIEAIKKSGAITKDTKWNLFLFSLIGFGVMLLGFLCLLVGLFVAIPVVMIATAFVYRKLVGQVEVAIETT